MVKHVRSRSPCGINISIKHTKVNDFFKYTHKVRVEITLQTKLKVD